MTPRKVRVKRGQAPLVIFPLPDKETFDRQWETYMVAYHGTMVNTDWGLFNGDQTRDKLTEIFNTFTDTYTLQRYQAWWSALHFERPANPI
jgi:dTDP-4-dehydrorhamnose 3,5-epimerase-like enzyme